MKRSLQFEFRQNSYILLEHEKTVFSINAKDLKFNALQFYKGVYSEKGISTNIEIENRVDDSDKTGKYVFVWLLEIVQAISEALPEENSDSVDITPSGKNSEESLPSKIIPLFEFATCAGDGFFNDDTIPHTDYSTNVIEADYAVTIAGHSMEPTIQDGAVVLVKKVDCLEHNEIGIFIVDGSIMCKRYVKKGRGVLLCPDNQSGEYSSIKASSVNSCILQGKVLGV